MPELRWETVLDELERRLSDVTGAAPAWVIPADLPPLPPELAGRAAALVDAQRRAILLLDEQRTRISEEVNSLRRTAPVAQHGRPVYFDVMG